MRYFIVGPENALTLLPDCKIEEGKREVIETMTLSGPVFVRGRKMPDICVFSLPPSTAISPTCLIVDEEATVYRIIPSKTEIGPSKFIVAGIVEEKFPAPELDEAKRLIAEKLKGS